MNITLRMKKLRLGLIYGLAGGLAFAVFAWGIDAWLLAQANSSYAWIKFIPGLFICLLTGGLAGWLTILTERHGFAVLFWGISGVIFSSMAVWLTFTGTFRFISLLNPQLAGYFRLSPLPIAVQFRVISLLIIGLAAVIAGLLEINLVHQALLSPYISSFIVSLLICGVIFALVGSATDHMINTITREPVQVVNSLLQFAQNNFGITVPKETARAMHLSSASQLGDLVEKPRRLTLISYDQNLRMLGVLVDFDGTRAKCSTIYSQPTDCIILTSNP
jgi:hypothetical protein